MRSNGLLVRVHCCIMHPRQSQAIWTRMVVVHPTLLHTVGVKKRKSRLPWLLFIMCIVPNKPQASYRHRVCGAPTKQNRRAVVHGSTACWPGIDYLTTPEYYCDLWCGPIECVVILASIGHSSRCKWTRTHCDSQAPLPLELKARVRLFDSLLGCVLCMLHS